MCSGCDYRSPQILFEYFLVLPSLLHPSVVLINGSAIIFLVGHTEACICGSTTCIAKYRLYVPSTSSLILIDHCIAEPIDGINFCQCGKGRHILYAIINKGGKKIIIKIFANESM